MPLSRLCLPRLPIRQATAFACLAWLAVRGTAGELDGVDDLVARAMQELHVPGAAVGVIRDGQVLLARGYGVRAAGGTDPVDADTLFALGSITKSFTTTIMAMQVDEGRLAWDKPVRTYLPWFQMYDPVATELMTPRDLVTHRSGLPRHDFLRMSTYLTREELVRRLRYLPPNRTFRDVYQYNNLMFVTAGFLSGSLENATWEELVRRRLLVPLGMSRSNTSVEESQRDPNTARPHVVRDGRAVEVPFYDYQKFGVGPNGAVNSCVNDLFRYMRLQLDRGRFGGRQLVSEAQMLILHKPVMLESASQSYALGWSVTLHRGVQVLEHGGAITGFTSQIILIPDRHVGIIVLNNLTSSFPRVAAWDIADRMLGLAPDDYLAKVRVERAEGEVRQAGEERLAEAGRRAGVPASVPMGALAGTYSHPAYGPVRIEAQDGALVVRFDALSLKLTPWSGDTYRCEGEGVKGLARFEVDPSGAVRAVLLPLEPAVEPFRFTRG